MKASGGEEKRIKQRCYELARLIKMNVKQENRWNTVSEIKIRLKILLNQCKQSITTEIKSDINSLWNSE